MFDARTRSLFEDLMRGGQQSQQAPGMGELGDLLRELTQPGQQGTGADRGRGDRSSDIGETNALDDLMRQFNQDRDAPSAGGSTGRSQQGGGFGLDDLLGQLTEGQGRGQGGGGVSQPSAPGAGSGPGAGGGLAYKAYQNYRNGQSPEASRNIVPTFAA